MIKLKDLIEERLSYKNLWTEAMAGMTVEPIEKEQARQFIEQHYLGMFPRVSQYHFGIFWEGELVGCSIYGPVSGHSAWKVLAVDERGNSVVTPQEVKELQRLFIVENKGPARNMESSAIAKSNKALEIANPEVAIVVTYADPAEGHVGTIYQATNAAYQQRGKDFKGYHVARLGKQDKYIKDRELRTLLTKTGRAHLVGGSSDSILQSGLPLVHKKVYGKFRYVYPIGKKGRKIEKYIRRDPNRPKEDDLARILDPEDYEAMLQKRHVKKTNKQPPEPVDISPDTTGWVGEQS